MKLQLDMNLNRSGFSRSVAGFELPLLHGLNTLLGQPVADGPNHGDIVSETVGADYNCQDYCSMNLCLVCFL